MRLDRVVSGIASVGTTIDWSRDLEADDSLTVPRIDGYYRFNPKHSIDFSWYELDIDGHTIVNENFDFGDITFEVGDEIVSFLRNEIYKVAYTYSFYHVKEIEVALSAGLHLMDLDVGISATNAVKEEQVTTLAPLPVFAFRLDYRFSPKWPINSKYELFFINIEDSFKGSLLDFMVAVEYKAFDNVNLGLGFNHFALQVEVLHNDFIGLLIIALMDSFCTPVLVFKFFFGCSIH